MFTRHAREQANEGQAGIQASTGELLALRHRARELMLGVLHPAASPHAGPHASRFRGRGMDYLESRSYQPGDDIRNMDWRVTARTGKPHTKLHQEERERPVVAFVDLSPTMFFGTRNALKSVVAARAAALLGWVSVLSGDRVGGLILNGHQREISPAGGRRGVVRLIRHLAEATEPTTGISAEPESGMNAALERLRRVTRPGSLVVLLSDLYQADERTRVHLVQLHQHCDLMLCHVVDPVEIDPLPPASYGITNGHRTGVLQTNRRSVLEQYRELCRTHADRAPRLVRGLPVPAMRLRTDADLMAEFRTALPGVAKHRRAAMERAA